MTKDERNKLTLGYDCEGCDAHPGTLYEYKGHWYCEECFEEKSEEK